MPRPGEHLARTLPGIWQGRSLRRNLATLPTGHAALDRQLPGHGWPLGAISELLTETTGHGEFSLLMPALAELSARGQWVVLVDPPWIPYPPAMSGYGVSMERVMLIRTRTPEESLWACEQVLRDIRGGAVLAWHDDPGFTRLRRLQLAARSALKTGFLFRPHTMAHQASPAALRLQLSADPPGTRIRVLKCQGQRAAESIFIRHSPHLPGKTRPVAGPEQDSTKGLSRPRSAPMETHQPYAH